MTASMKEKEETLKKTMEVLSKEKESRVNDEKDLLLTKAVAVVLIGVAAVSLWAFFKR